MKRLGVLAIVAACSTSGPSLEKASIGNLVFGTPAGWERHDVSSPQRTMLEWRPSTDDNERKESLTIVRADRPATAKATPAELHEMLIAAQRRMPGAELSAARSITTRHGFHGAVIETSFVPPGGAARYRRVHAVLVDGTAMVNVLYTARDPDRASFDAVIDSFFREDV